MSPARRGALSLAVLTLAAALVQLPTVGAAQEPGARHLSLSRGTAGVDTLRAHVTFSGGVLRVTPSDTNVLYHADVRYDTERARPVASFDASRGALEIGAQAGPLSRGFGLRRMREDRRRDAPIAELTLRLSRTTPTELVIDATAARGEIELGGLQLHLLRVGASASETHLTFSSANPAHLARLDLSARAATMHVNGLAAANAERVVATVTAGQLELAFGDDWPNVAILEASATLGQLRIIVPGDVAVRLTARERLLGRVEGVPVLPDGVYQSANWDTATRRLEVLASVTMGTITVDRARR